MNRPLVDVRQLREYISVLEKVLEDSRGKMSPGGNKIKYIPTSQEMVNPLNYPTLLYRELEKIGNDKLIEMKSIGISPVEIINHTDGNAYCSQTYPEGKLVSDKEISQALNILTTYVTVRTWQDKLKDLPTLKLLENIL